MEIPILMYHEILDDNESDPALLSLMQSSYFVKKSVFEKQMGFLYDEGFKVISLYELIDCFNQKSGRRLPDKSLVITFDDGYMGNYKYAFPILKKLKFTATIFCTVKLIGNPYMMGWEELKFLSKNGISIQSHTVSHPFLKQLRDAEVINELKESKFILEDNLGSKVDFISLPHGSYGKNYNQIAVDLGYLGGCSSNAGLNNNVSDKFLLRRIHISGNYKLAKFTRIVNKETLIILSIRAEKSIKLFVKKTLGEKFYLKFYNLFFRLKSRNILN